MSEAAQHHRDPADDPGVYAPISDYAVIGDCRSAALVSRDGSIDWLCWPRFDSPSVFGALLDARVGGRFRVAPAGEFTVRRRYLPETNILETTFSTGAGELRLVDFMPVATEADKDAELWPEHQILRLLECRGGEIEVRVVCEPRPDFGRLTPALEDHGRLGIHFVDGIDAFTLSADFPLKVDESGARVVATLRLRPGQTAALSLSAAHGMPAVLPPLGTVAERRLEQTQAWWTWWASRVQYDGPFRDAVVRSALVLKLMTYAPTGAVIAAPTTSLPEEIGGIRNWDYRYCWLRDASMTLRALHDLGYRLEAEAFFSWMLHATRPTWPLLHPLYDVYGEHHIPERTLDHLEGYRGSRPVRVGNAAARQLQLDVFGDVVAAVFQYVRRGRDLDRTESRLLRQLGRTVCRHWREPDEGIWEIRAERRHHTYSKVMCWVALDRLLALAESGHLDVPSAEFERERDAIREAVEQHGWNPHRNSYVATFDGDEVDASLLLLGVHRFVHPDSARMRATHERIVAELGVDGLLYRYLNPDGLPGDEGAFGICGFWEVRLDALAGRREEAERELGRMIDRANDVGLFAEEIDPVTGALLGNFPQAFTHVGLIGAALALAGREKEEAHAGGESRTSRGAAARTSATCCCGDSWPPPCSPRCWLAGSHSASPA